MLKKTTVAHNEGRVVLQVLDITSIPRTAIRFVQVRYKILHNAKVEPKQAYGREQTRRFGKFCW